MRKTENEEVNNIMMEFFIKCGAQNIPATGPMLQTKAAEIVSSLQIEKFSAGNDWLEAFQCRNNINIASSAEGILEDIMMGRVQGAPLDDEQEVEEEEVDQQPPNRPSSHSEALQRIHSLMQFAQTNLPHLQPALINIYSEIERNWATANIQKKKQTTLHQFFTTAK